MLTTDEREQIKSEEIYRDEVKKSLEKKKGVMSFLNSPLGIWLLSSVLLGAFTYAFSEYTTYRKTSAEREERILRLDMEIESRISQFWVRMKAIDSSNDTSNRDIKIRGVWEAFKQPNIGTNTQLTAMYKENEGRTTISLMMELRELLVKKYGLKEKDREIHPKKGSEENRHWEEVNQIKGAVIFIAVDGIYENGLYQSVTPTTKDIWKSFSEKIINERWNHTFPYTDCLFC